MSRLLIFWTGPRHLKAEEAEEWARSEARRLLEPDADARELIKHELWRTWLGELRLLRLGPRVLLAGPGVEI